jgi:hypothetical protein
MAIKSAAFAVMDKDFRLTGKRALSVGNRR